LSEPVHVPVLLAETLEGLAPGPGKRFLDLTVGWGGHTRGLLDAMGGGGFVFGIDRDAELLDETVKQLRRDGYGPDRFETAAGNLADIDVLLGGEGLLGFDGVLADLGVSSAHLDRPERGFSFREAGPLDMRFDRSSGRTLKELIEDLDEAALRRILWEYGEERYAGRVARAIIRSRDAEELTDTAALAETIRNAIPAKSRYSGKIDAATRSFQGLRIAVNEELDSVRTGLRKVVDGMKPGARLAVISFHSLEDRLVKRLFRSVSLGEKDWYGNRELAGARELNRKPIEAGEAEVAANPRARSAKLRVIEKLKEGPIVPASWGANEGPGPGGERRRRS
jgi:16S rRNA (cytosine1402-N4)-methyltransferase